MRFWFARICSTISFQVAAVAVGWQVYALTHSTFALGMVGLVQFLPMLLLTLVVGHVADRFNRKTIISICQVVEAIDPGAAGGEQLSSPVASVRHLLCGCGHRGRAGLREPVDPGPGPRIGGRREGTAGDRVVDFGKPDGIDCRAGARRTAVCVWAARAVWFVRLLICDGGGVVLNHRFQAA